jgi:predicted PurR-regulated permease PerM
MLLFMGIIYFIYETKGLWINIGNKMLSILFPFLISFTLAYALYPLVKFFENYFSKIISIVITIFLVILTFILLIPLLINQLGCLITEVLAFIKEMSLKYEFDLELLTNYINDIDKYISGIIKTSIEIFSISFITLASTIYLLFDMERIREKIKIYCNTKNNYKYIKALDDSMHNYFDGFIKIIIITIIEYSITFFLIGHPNAILLGILAAIGNLIPFFGGLITNIIAAITSFVIGPKLFIRTLITFIVLSIVDSYIINPYIYSKSNKLHPIIVIFSIFAGGKLFGMKGIIVSLPITILIITTINYYKQIPRN